jgi:preprotein translocase SecE subunit
MTNAFQQYLKDTQNELHHVAWPTRNQTIVYTILVAVISVGLSMYLGMFDFIFTTGLTRAIGAYVDNTSATQAPAVIISTSSPAGSTEAPATSTPADFNLDNLGNKQQQ